MSFATRRVSIAARLVREIGGVLRTRPAKIDWPGGVVSFTFDDFPRSAWTNGGAILGQYDVRGTYYAAMGLASTANHLGTMFDIDDLRAVHERGHEVACHTYHHVDCGTVPRARMADEITENAAALARVLGNAAIDNFAYPFGGVTLAAKNALAGRFASCRGTGRGLNKGTIDLADLLSTSLYARGFDSAGLCRLIDAAKATGGWVIFYTHDVSDEPSDFGCTPAQFQSVVAYAVEHAAVLPVRDVVARLGATTQRAA
jgi:peptidoglycan/xylan/chitin deacetylase (PgdA/CDA1 family)